LGRKKAVWKLRELLVCNWGKLGSKFGSKGWPTIRGWLHKVPPYRSPLGKLWVRSHTPPQMPGTARAIPVIPFSGGPFCCLAYTIFFEVVKRIHEAHEADANWNTALVAQILRSQVRTTNPNLKPSHRTNIVAGCCSTAPLGRSVSWGKIEVRNSSSGPCLHKPRNDHPKGPDTSTDQAFPHVAASPGCPAEWQTGPSSTDDQIREDCQVLPDLARFCAGGDLT
jgi:hypothetical protein